MRNLIPFEFEANQLRVITDERGEPLFVGKDAAIALGYSNHNDAISRHCRGVVERYPIIDALGREQKVRVLREPDLYRLIAGSTLPSAQAFERLVFEEILPTIRKTGGYRADQPRHTKSNPVRDLLMIGEALAAVPGVDRSLAMACTLETIAQVTGMPVNLMGRALPNITPADAATMNATQLGEHFGMNARATNALLESLGLQARDGKHWVLTESGAAHGEMKPFHRNGHSGYELRWKPSVLDVLRTFMARQSSSDAAPQPSDEQPR